MGLHRAISGLFALGLVANGTFMLGSPAVWYLSIPGVPDTGPYNPHFVRDIGCAFLVAATGFAWSVFDRDGQVCPRSRPRLLSRRHRREGHRGRERRSRGIFDRARERAVMTESDDERRILIGLAYRMLGSVSDAEDVVQDAWVRWHRLPDPSVVHDARAYRAKTTVRLAIDRLKSARARREVYVGPWLPEPVLDVEALGPPPAPSPEAASELASDLSVALLLALERLSPLERAAFLLHDVFDTDWPEVAATLERSEAACRQLAARARVHVRQDRPRFHPTLEERDRFLAAFAGALATGDPAELGKLLTDDAVFLGDGGGEVKSARKPVTGRDRVARLLLGLQAKAIKENAEYRIEPEWINGDPGFVLRSTTRPIETLSLDVGPDGRVRGVYVVSNPAKLQHLG